MRETKRATSSMIWKPDFDSWLYHDCPDHLNDDFVDVILYVLNHHDSITLDKLHLKFGFDYKHELPYL